MKTEWTRELIEQPVVRMGEIDLMWGHRLFLVAYTVGLLILVGTAIYGISNELKAWNAYLLGVAAIGVIASVINLVLVYRQTPRLSEK
jgi:hypothetical protein